MLDGSDRAELGIRSTCPYCGVGCGVIAKPDGRGSAAISGDPDHPANFGRLCSKGSALGETFDAGTRLLSPSISGVTATWDEAIDHVAGELARIRETYGPKSIAFYLSGQLLTEDYYVANKLAKGFIGTPNVDTNSRLCMASSVAGHKRAFGADIVPGNYEDLDSADLVVLVGSNAAWCHPILYQRMQAARAARGTRVVNIDPRQTATSEGADIQLSLASGSDAALWNGLLVWLFDNRVADLDYIEKHTDGFPDALARARKCSGSIAKVALQTGLPEADIEGFYRLWAATPRVVTCYSQGVNQSAFGTDKVNTIINCHLATGRIGKTGAGPFSLTGQPNAMGGREVGGLANMLAAHLGFSSAERDLVRRFWNAPNLVDGEGLKATELFAAVANGGIKALWVIGTNPAVSLPKADEMRAGLAKLELFVVSDVVHSNDTIGAAAVRLPAHGWGEKDGTVTNSERRISRQRGFLDPAGDAMPDWWILSRVAERLGWGDAFAYTSPAEIFCEYAALTAFENRGNRVLDLSGLSVLTAEEYDDLEPVQWPVSANGGSTSRLFSDGRFATADQKGRFVAVTLQDAADATNDEWPVLLNTGRIRDQWHTMTRTGLVARLWNHLAEPFVELHPEDARAYGVTDGHLVQLQSRHGSAVVRAAVTERVGRGTAFAPIHWSDQNSSSARIGSIVHAIVDQISGQPDLKATPVRITPIGAGFEGYILSVNDPAEAARCNKDIVYWSVSKADNGYVMAFAVRAGARDVQGITGALVTEGRRISYRDETSGEMRLALFEGRRLVAVVSAGEGHTLKPGSWLQGMLGRADLSATERRALLAGRMPDGAAPTGPIVCVCHQVGANAIETAIAHGCTTSASIGKACKAGTNCGSCLPEINRMLRAAAPLSLLNETDRCDPAYNLTP